MTDHYRIIGYDKDADIEDVLFETDDLKEAAVVTNVLYELVQNDQLRTKKGEPYDMCYCLDQNDEPVTTQ